VSSAGVQEHTIDVAAEFTPASVTLKAGQPARLHFRRGDKPTCADEIVIPALNVRKKLAANQTVTIDIPAQQARTLTFACGMDMMKGSLVVQ
jgi:plastocyanin domain-containing protein